MKRIDYLCLFAFAGLCCDAAVAGSIHLKTGAAVEPGAPVRVIDVAALEGDDAMSLGETIVLEDAAKATAGRPYAVVSIADVRRALEAAGARLSRLSLNGSSCAVRINGAAVQEQTIDPVPRPEARPEVVDLAGPVTVRKHAAAALASLHGVDADDLRVLFDAEDASFLDEIRTGVDVVVQPQTTAAAGRAVLSCRIIDGDRILESRTIRADAEVRRRAVVVHEKVKRKDEIPLAALTEEEMWLPASGGTPIGRIEEAAGSLARTRIEAGAVLREELLETPIVMKRNELVSVYAVRAGFEVQTRARARADARRGDVIPFRIDGSKKEFLARVERAGVAVMAMDGGRKADSE